MAEGLVAADVNKLLAAQKEYFSSMEGFLKDIKKTSQDEAKLVEKIHKAVTQTDGKKTEKNDEKKLTEQMEKSLKSSFERMEASIDAAINGMFSGTQSFGSGFKSVFKSIVTELARIIAEVWAKEDFLPRFERSVKKRLPKVFGKDGEEKKDKTDKTENAETAIGPAQSKSAAQQVAVKAKDDKADEKAEEKAKLIKDSVKSIQESIDLHIKNMLDGVEEFRVGFMNIVKKLAQEFLAVTLKMWVNNQFSKWIGSMFGKKDDSKYPFKVPTIEEMAATASLNKMATGGTVVGASTYLVGEAGPELFMPYASGTIVPNHRIMDAVGASNAPAVTVNVVNNTGVQANARQQEARWDGRQYVVDVVLDAYARNVSGMRDIMGTARG